MMGTFKNFKKVISESSRNSLVLTQKIKIAKEKKRIEKEKDVFRTLTNARYLQ